MSRHRSAFIEQFWRFGNDAKHLYFEENSCIGRGCKISTAQWGGSCGGPKSSPGFSGSTGITGGENDSRCGVGMSFSGSCTLFVESYIKIAELAYPDGFAHGSTTRHLLANQSEPSKGSQLRYHFEKLRSKSDSCRSVEIIGRRPSPAASPTKHRTFRFLNNPDGLRGKLKGIDLI